MWMYTVLFTALYCTVLYVLYTSTVLHFYVVCGMSFSHSFSFCCYLLGSTVQYVPSYYSRSCSRSCSRLVIDVCQSISSSIWCVWCVWVDTTVVCMVYCVLCVCLPFFGAPPPANQEYAVWFCGFRRLPFFGTTILPYPYLSNHTYGTDHCGINICTRRRVPYHTIPYHTILRFGV